MRILALAMATLAMPAAAQDADRGRLLYETHCGSCHYERVHQRPRERSLVRGLEGLRAEVGRRAALTGRSFTREDLADIVAYLDRSYYGFAVPPPAHELIFGAELMTPEEREAYRRELDAAGSTGAAQVRERHRQRIRARAKAGGVQLDESSGLVKP